MMKRGMRGGWVLAVLVATGLSATSLAAEPKAKAPATAAVTPARKGKLVFVATTGLEDLGTLSSSFRHAVVAMKSGYLESVVWLGYGRSVVALDPTVRIPELVSKHAEEAKAAGVDIVVCKNALANYGIDPKTLLHGARVVDAGVVELSRLVAEGYQIIRY